MPKETRTTILAFKASIAQREAIERAAQKQGKSLSDFLRDGAIENVKNEGIDFPELTFTPRAGRTQPAAIEARIEPFPVHTFHELFAGKKGKNLRILTTYTALIGAQYEYIRTALKEEEMRFECLLMHPTSPIAKQRSTALGKPTDWVAKQVRANLTTLNRLIGDAPEGSIEVRLYATYTPFRLYQVVGEAFYLGFLTIGEPGIALPHLRISELPEKIVSEQQHNMIRLANSQFKALWDNTKAWDGHIP